MTDQGPPLIRSYSRLSQAWNAEQLRRERPEVVDEVCLILHDPQTGASSELTITWRAGEPPHVHTPTDRCRSLATLVTMFRAMIQGYPESVDPDSICEIAEQLRFRNHTCTERPH